MPEQSKQVKCPHQGEANPSKKILKLGKKITDCVPHKLFGVKSTDPEYWGLREIVTDEMADVALKMKLREHYTFDQLYKMNKEKYPNAADLQKLLDDMAWIGILEYDYGDNYDHYGELKDKPRVRRYSLPFYVPGSAEFFNSRKQQIDEHPAVASFFERMTFIPLAGVTQMLPEGGDGVGMHVIPVEKAIDMQNESIDIEKISYWLKKYEGHIAAGICSCRYSRGALGDGCADDCEDWCIQVGDMADFVAETGKGHYITKERALEILQKAEDNGFVHQITNIDGENKIFAICNCNVKICNALRTSMLFNTPNLSRSAYTAKVTTEKCVACGMCVTICPAGAPKLGQKLCHKDGSQFEYPKAILPNKIKWGKYAWDENYRDTHKLSDTYETGTAPCKAACPAHVPVQGYLQLAKEGKYQEALALIKTQNPFPAVCGRVCNKRCEMACTRGTIDEAVSIDAVKKFVADYDLNSPQPYVPKKIVPSLRGEFDEKIAIIGAGPAGLTAAYYLCLLGYKPTIFERRSEPGGMLRYGIPSYKLEKDVIRKEIDVIKSLGAEIRCNVEVGKDITIADLKNEGYKAFYISIGCQGGRRPGVKNDEANNTVLAVDYLANAIDNKQEFNGNVVVIGGGNVAVDCARTAKRLNAKSVKMISLEKREEMPASLLEVKETLEEGIEIINSYGPKEVIVDETNNVKQIILKKCTQTLDPKTRKFAPLYNEDETIVVDADQIIFAIGQAIVWNDLLKDTKVTYWKGNYPIADKMTYQTADEDIFVGGDVFTGPKFVIDAIAAGHAVADAIHRHVQPRASMTIGFERRKFTPLNKDDILVKGYDNAKRQDEGMDESIDYKNSFKDAHKTFTEEQVKIETNRCLSCGASVVDPNKCIGCGLCTTVCQFDAIHLVRDHPKASKMVKAEKKYLPMLGYVAKRGVNIALNSFSKEAKIMRKKRKEFNKKYKETKKSAPNTGNSVNA